MNPCVFSSARMILLECRESLADDLHWLGIRGVYVKQCSRSKSSTPFKRDLALQNIPLSQQPFKTQPQIENEDVTWSPRYNLHVTRINKCRALSRQEVELDGWFLFLHVVLKTCTISFVHKFNTSFVFYFYILGSTSWILNQPFNWRAKIWVPLKMKLIWRLPSSTLT